jgi:hypothetical protein
MSVFSGARRAKVPEGKDLTEYAQRGGHVAAWIADRTGVYAWHVPSDAIERVKQSNHWLAVFDDEFRSGEDRAQAWARYMVCTGAGAEIASDGLRWSDLAQ